MRRLLCFLLPRAFTEIALKYASYPYMPFLVPRPSSRVLFVLSTGAAQCRRSWRLLQLRPAASVAMRRCITVRRQRRGLSYGYVRRGPATGKASRRRRCPSNSVGLHAEYTVGTVGALTAEPMSLQLAARASRVRRGRKKKESHLLSAFEEIESIVAQMQQNNAGLTHTGTRSTLGSRREDGELTRAHR